MRVRAGVTPRTLRGSARASDHRLQERTARNAHAAPRLHTRHFFSKSLFHRMRRTAVSARGFIVLMLMFKERS